MPSSSSPSPPSTGGAAVAAFSSRTSDAKMAAQRKQSLTLICIMMAAALLLPALVHPTSLLCHFCPLQPKESPCTNLSTECMPGQRCATSRAYYGVVHVLSSQGCVDARLCGNHLAVSHMGVEYRLRHSCCCKDKCNMMPTSQDVLKMLLGVLAEKGENDNTTRALREKLWGSCGDDPGSPEPSAFVS